MASSKPAAPVQHPPYLGGMATMTAALFTNPAEVVKIRMQLQGELQQAGTYQKPYKNVFQAAVAIVRDEGVRGIQAGLVPALGYQAVMNGIRLGSYDRIKALYMSLDHNGDYTWFCSFLAGGTAGVIGASLGSPFYLAKTRMQAQGTGEIHVGTQYGYKNMRDCFRKVYRAEGIPGLWAGVTSAMARVAVGSSLQLSSYDTIKAKVVSLGLNAEHSSTHLVSSMAASLVVVLGMNPVDCISTRMYAQPHVNGKGTLYAGLLDCALKILRSEGPTSFYKGVVAHYLRLGPHTVLTFVFWERLKILFAKYAAGESKEGSSLLRRTLTE